MKRTCVLLMILLISSFLLMTACEFDAPTCTEMPTPILISPGGSVEDTWLEPVAYPTFTWSFSGECEPDSFRLIVSTIKGDPAFYGAEFKFLEVEINRTEAGPTIVYADGSTARIHAYTSSEPFDVGTYYWRITPYSGDFHGERSEWMAFTVFSPCASPSQYTLAPRLVYPRNGQTVNTIRPKFLWLDENTCSIPGYYIVQVDETGLFLGAGMYESPRYNWPEWSGFVLDYCKTYYWHVLPVFGYWVDDIGPVSQVYTFNTAAADGGACDASASTPAAEASGIPYAEVVVNANCRTGPTLEYPVMDTLPAENQYEIHARNRLGGAWLIFNSRINDFCWIDADLVRVIGDTSLVDIVDLEPPHQEPPAIDTSDAPTSVDCSIFNQNPVECENNNACWWDPSVAPNGVCKNK